MDLQTNAALLKSPPAWINSTRINKIADNIQSELEWSIRRVTVIWHLDQAAFEKVHKLGALPRAVALKNKNEIHLGPKVTKENFDTIFGHELVHMVAFQKYKQAIPAWLEEGLANDISKNSRVDYPWLIKQQLPSKVTDLAHPFQGDEGRVPMHYAASQALVEMLRDRCDFKNLLRLSVGRTMESYLVTYCGIKDLSKSFHEWIKKKAGQKSPPKIKALRLKSKREV